MQRRLIFSLFRMLIWDGLRKTGLHRSLADQWARRCLAHGVVIAMLINMLGCFGTVQNRSPRSRTQSQERMLAKCERLARRDPRMARRCDKLRARIEAEKVARQPKPKRAFAIGRYEGLVKQDLLAFSIYPEGQAELTIGGQTSATRWLHPPPQLRKLWRRQLPKQAIDQLILLKIANVPIVLRHEEDGFVGVHTKDPRKLIQHKGKTLRFKYLGPVDKVVLNPPSLKGDYSELAILNRSSRFKRSAFRCPEGAKVTEEKTQLKGVRLTALTCLKGGKKSGPFVTYDNKGMKIMEGQSKDGEVVGYLVTRDRSGAITSISTYEDGKRHGMSYSWKGRSVATQQLFSAGRIVEQSKRKPLTRKPPVEVNDFACAKGDTLSEHQGRGFKERSCTRPVGRPIADNMIRWSTAGQLLLHRDCKPRTTTCRQVEFAPSGRLLRVIHFVDKRASGLNTDWYPHGPIKSQTEYKDGVRHGSMKIYDRAGILMETGFYKANKKEGRWWKKTPFGPGRTTHFKNGKQFYSTDELAERKARQLMRGLGRTLEDWIKVSRILKADPKQRRKVNQSGRTRDRRRICAKLNRLSNKKVSRAKIVAVYCKQNFADRKVELGCTGTNMGGGYREIGRCLQVTDAYCRGELKRICR